MGYSKNYIMYWGVFYGYYNTMNPCESVHKPHKKYDSFLVILYKRKQNKKDSFERCLFRRRYFYYGV